MSKKPDARGKEDAEARSSPLGEPLPPLKPQRGLFVLTALLLIGAFASILWLYITTVYPHR